MSAVTSQAMWSAVHCLYKNRRHIRSPRIGKRFSGFRLLLTALLAYEAFLRLVHGSERIALVSGLVF